MKYFKDRQTEIVYAFEADGSQDEFITGNLVAISKDEADQIILGKQSARQDISPQEKLIAFLKSNPDVKSLIDSV